jgi:pimeloyl-ACP methyl ester carboxylesterase
MLATPDAVVSGVWPDPMRRRSGRWATPRHSKPGGGQWPPARCCVAVAELIPGAQFQVMEEEAHQPFQEIPDEWNARVDAFWRQHEMRD